MSQFDEPAFGSDPPPKKKSSAMMWILIILGVTGLMVVVCCGGSGGLVYFTMQYVANDVRKDLAASPEAMEALGEVQDVSMNIMASGEEKNRSGRQVNVCDVKGTKGSGIVIVENAGLPDRVSTLRMQDGREVNLPPQP